MVRKILLLDVGGVLNTTTMAGASSPAESLHPTLLQNLVGLVNTLGDELEIVLSSTWRNHENYRLALLDALERLGIPRARIVGGTPKLESGMPILRTFPQAIFGESMRSTEIAQVCPLAFFWIGCPE